MITIKNVRNLLGELETIVMPNESEEKIDAAGDLTLFPALIDVGPNVVKNWEESARKAINGGVTTLFHLIKFFQNDPKKAKAEKEQIDKQLFALKVPLHHRGYLELGANTLEDLGKLRSEMAAVAISGKHSFEEKFVDRIFQLAAQEDCIIAVMSDEKEPTKVRQAIGLAEKYSAQLLLLNISHAVEIEYLREAKKSELLIHSATSPSALQIHEYLWEAIYDKTIDIVASGATESESDIILPTLLEGYHAKKITLEGVVAVTRTNAEQIFRLSYNSDITLVDLEKAKTCKNGKILRGWPHYVSCNGFTFTV